MATSYLSRVRMLGRDVRLFLFAGFLSGFTVYGGMFSVLLNLYLLRLGYGTERIGWVNAVSGFAFAAFCLPAGALGTRWGSRRTMVAGTAVAVTGFGLLPLAQFPSSGGQFAWLLATHTLAWLGLALFFVNSIPFLMSATGPEERTHAFAVRTAMSPLAGFAGSLAGGLLPQLLSRVLAVPLDQPAPYRWTLLIASLMFVPAPFALLFTREPGAQRAQPAPEPAGAPRGRAAPYGLLALIALVGFLRCGGSGAVSTFFNVYLDTALGASTATVGVLSAAGRLAAMAAALALPVLVRRIGTGSAVVLGSVGTVLGILPLVLFPHWLPAGLGFVATVALYTMSSLSYTLYTQDAVQPAWRAAMSGVTNLAAQFSVSVVALGGGYAIASLGWPLYFAIGASLTAAGAAVFWAYLRRTRAHRAIGKAASVPSEQAETATPLQLGIAAARAGNHSEARQHFRQILQTNPRHKAAWMWLGGVVDSDAERVHCLRQVLLVDPSHVLARRGLDTLEARMAPRATALPSPTVLWSPPSPPLRPPRVGGHRAGGELANGYQADEGQASGAVCPHCGTPKRRISSFCTECGHTLARPPTPSTPPPAEGKPGPATIQGAAERTRVLLTALFILLLLLLVVVCSVGARVIWQTWVSAGAPMG